MTVLASTDALSNFTLPVGSIWKLNTYKILGKENQNATLMKIASCLRAVIEQYAKQQKQIDYEIADSHINSFEIVYSIFENKNSNRFTILSGKRKLLDNSSVDSLFFFYRIQPCYEIYAFTTARSFNIIKDYTDYQFTTKIAKRILSCEEIIRDKKRKILGTKAASHSFYSEKIPMWRGTNIYSITEEFHTRCRKSCSLFALEPFKTTQALPSVSLSKSHLRFSEELTVNQLASLINHLALIDKLEKTYLYKGDTPTLEEEQDSMDFEFLEYTQPVNFQLWDELEVNLITEIWSYFKGSQKSFSLFHPKYDEFSKHDTVQLRKGNESKKIIDRTTVGILSIVKEFKPPLNSFKAFLEFLLLLELGFKDSYVPFVQATEGSVCLNGNTYFKIKGRWIQFSVEFNTTIHRAFYNFFDKHTIKGCNKFGPWIEEAEHVLSPLDKTHIPKELVEDKSNLVKIKEGFLVNPAFIKLDPFLQQFITCKWLTQFYLGKRKIEKANNINYFANQVYHSKSFFICADTLDKNGIELFDLMEVNEEEQTIYLYQTKNGIGKESREACSQLLMAAKQVSASLMCSSSETFLESYYRQLIQSHKARDEEAIYKNLVKECLIRKFGGKIEGVKKFLQQFLSIKNIYFVYLYSNGPLESVQLPKSEPFTAEDFKEVKEKGKAIGGIKILKLLQQKQYLDEHGRITDRFVDSRYDKLIRSFELEGGLSITAHQEIYKILKTAFEGPIDSAVAKHTLLNTQRSIEELAPEGWKFHFKLLSLLPQSLTSTITPPATSSALLTTPLVNSTLSQDETKNFLQVYEEARCSFQDDNIKIQWKETPLVLEDFLGEEDTSNSKIKEKITEWWNHIFGFNKQTSTYQINKALSLLDSINLDKDRADQEDLTKLRNMAHKTLKDLNKIKIRERILRRKIKNILEELSLDTLPSLIQLEKATHELKSVSVEKWFETYQKDWAEWIKDKEVVFDIPSIDRLRQEINNYSPPNLAEQDNLITACCKVFIEMARNSCTLQKDEIEILASIYRKVPQFYTHSKGKILTFEPEEIPQGYKLIRIYEKEQVFHLISSYSQVNKPLKLSLTKKNDATCTKQSSYSLASTSSTKTTSPKFKQSTIQAFFNCPQSASKK